MTEHWRDRAACRAPGVDSSAFYPPPLEKGEHWDTTEAKAVCAACPVRQACLAEALANSETDGVWGGFNFASRTERAAARHGVTEPMRPCAECLQPFIPRPAQVVCSTACRNRRARKRYHGERRAS